ncbi:MAG: BsuPI-related putative proteinase inhibitor [Bacillota bacterium]
MRTRRAMGMLLALVMAFAGVTTAAQAAGSSLAVPEGRVSILPDVVVNSDSIEMYVTIANRTSRSVSIRYPSGQTYDFQLLDSSGKTLYTWSADKSFIAAERTQTLRAGEIVTYSETLSGSAYRSIKNKIDTFRAYITGKASFIDATGYEVPLQANTLVKVSANVVPGNDSLKMSVTITNGSNRDVRIQFPTIQRYDFRLYDSKRNLLYSSYDDGIYRQTAASVTIKAGSTLTCSDTISGDDYKDIKNKISYMKAYVKGSASFIDPSGYTVEFSPSTFVTVTSAAAKTSAYVKMSITVRNASLRHAYIKHPTGQKYDFQLLDANKNVLYTWSQGRSFDQSGSTTKVPVGTSLTWSAVVSGSTYQAIKNKVAYLRAYVEGSADFVDAEGYLLKIE